MSMPKPSMGVRLRELAAKALERLKGSGHDVARGVGHAVGAGERTVEQIGEARRRLIGKAKQYVKEIPQHGRAGYEAGLAGDAGKAVRAELDVMELQRSLGHQPGAGGSSHVIGRVPEAKVVSGGSAASSAAEKLKKMYWPLPAPKSSDRPGVITESWVRAKDYATKNPKTVAGAAAGAGALALMTRRGDNEKEKASMDYAKIVEKTASLVDASASPEERAAALLQVAIGEGFEAALAKRAAELGYGAGLAKVAADEEKGDEKGEKKDEEDTKKRLPPWLEKAKEKAEKKNEDEKKSSARPILYNKLTAMDVASHLEAQFGRVEPVEKSAAIQKFAALLEKELSARPT